VTAWGRAALSPTAGKGWVDLEAGVFYRRAIGRRETKKRQTPVRIPPRLLCHLRRWARLGISKRHVVEWNDRPVKRLNKGFRSARRLAGLGADVVPHSLRHTCATWLAQRRVLAAYRYREVQNSLAHVARRAIGHPAPQDLGKHLPCPSISSWRVAMRRPSRHPRRRSRFPCILGRDRLPTRRLEA
jgi:integrase